MGFSVQDLSNELYARIDQAEGMPPLKKSGLMDIAKATFDIISQALVAGETIVIPKFGKFEIIERSARKGRNPQTGEDMDIPAKKVVKFRVSSTLRTAVANSDVEVEKPVRKKKVSSKKTSKDRKK